ncbi:MAG: hypothetical protein JWO80_4254 [Bryobacterales bacterium]|nr:hypothetical protein [Bryobacterales bacterium]
MLFLASLETGLTDDSRYLRLAFENVVAIRPQIVNGAHAEAFGMIVPRGALITYGSSALLPRDA